MNEDARRVADLMAADPSLASNLLRWAEQAASVGGNGVFAAYRDHAAANGEAGGVAGLAPRRRVGAQPVNRLYHADNEAVLRRLLDDDVSVRCVYIDPPYGTRQQFARKVTDHAAYCDAASGGEYLAALRTRLVLLRDLLADDGSIFVHLDAWMVAEVKLLLDEVFGAGNFRAWITRRKCSSKNYTRRTFGDIADYVLFYSKGPNYLFNRQYERRTPEQEAIDFPKLDPESGRRFALVPLHAPCRRNGATGGPWRGILPPPGKHWQWTPEKLDECDAKGDIYWTRNGTPRRKIWADESAGSAVANLWHDFRDPFNQNFAITGYPTEKNLDLLKRIVSAATEPGDLVLDCYAGSGTTLAAAAALGRRWIGVDRGELAVALAQKRLAEQIFAAEVPADGGGFDVWGETRVATPRAIAAEDVEFGLLEACQPGDDLPEVRDVLTAAQVAGGVEALRGGERLVAFDHGGSEVVYDAADSIQSMEKRPA